MVSKLQALQNGFPTYLTQGSKTNFSTSEIAVLTEKVKENLLLIQSKFTNQKKN